MKMIDLLDRANYRNGFHSLLDRALDRLRAGLVTNFLLATL
jgi:hypothetical protein